MHQPVKASQREWVVLFGGARREPVVQKLRERGIAIAAVIVPRTQSVVLQQSVAALQALGIHVCVVAKADLDAALRPFAHCALLSVGFPYLLPESLLCRHDLRLNLHPTLLPAYRGPTTGPYILMNNEPASGSTVHFLEPEMDAGDIVAQNRVPLSVFDTVRSMQRKVYAEEPALIIQALERLDAGIVPTPQDQAAATVFPKKRTPEDSEIDPTKSLLELVHVIRACDPEHYPAFFRLDGQKVCVRLWRPERPDEDGADSL